MLCAAASLLAAVSPLAAQAQSASGSASRSAPDGSTPDTAAQARRPNVLFIIADDLNTRLGSYGGPAVTPNIDKLARQAVVFDRAYSQNPWCGPSRASFLTGTRPNTNGVNDITTHFRAKLPDIVTLPGYFRQNGYHTARVGKIFHQGVPGGIGRDGLDDAQAWDEKINPVGCDTTAYDRLTNLTPGIPLGSAMAYLRDSCPDARQTDGLVAEQATRLLTEAARGDKPFFISVGFYRPHVPEIVPSAYFDLYRRDRIAASADTPEQLGRVLPAAKVWTPDHLGMTAEEQRDFTHAYYAAMSFMDAQVGKVLKAVDDLGLANDTIVIFTSDHGFLLGEHGQWQKQMLFEESARVPLMIRVPGNGNAGKRSPRTVEMLDIYPTLTDLAGLPRYARNEGLSLSRLLADPEDRSWTKPALSQVNGGRSVRTERYRYTEWEGGKSGRELYDHANDPHEQVNLADDPAYAGAVELLRAMLPGDPVEPLPSRARYDPKADCLVPSDRYRAPAAAGQNRTGNPKNGDAGGGDGILGLKVCDLRE